MFSVFAAILAIGISPTITFVRETPRVSQYYKGDYERVLRDMNQDFLHNKFPGFATFVDAHNLSVPHPYIKVRLIEALPVWTDKKSHTPKEGLAWNKMYAIMDEHEKIHLDINQEAFVRGLKEMGSKTPAEAERIYKNCVLDAIQLNVIYDSVSDHSRKQERWRALPGNFAQKYDHLLELRKNEKIKDVKFRF